VLSEIGRALWLPGRGLPYLLPLVALLLAPGKRRTLWLPVGVAVVLCVFSVFTYLHGDPDPALWIRWSAGRIFSPVAPLLAIAGICAGKPEAGKARPEEDARGQ
jgi:hypothetical protein